MTAFLQAVINALSVGGIYALGALGIALVFGVMRLINFAYGELIMVAAYSLMIFSGMPWPIALAGPLVSAVLLALLMERIAFRPVRGASEATLFVTSFAVSSLIQNVVILIAGSRPSSVNAFSELNRAITVAGLRISWIDIATFAATVVLLISISLLLNRSLVGLQIRAVSENARMARALGIRGNRVIVIVFAISGVLAGVTSLLLVARTGSLDVQMGSQPALIGFVATVIGGMGSLRGAVLGGYLIGVVTVGLQVLLPDEIRPYRDAFVFVCVIFVLLTRPLGLLPTKLSKERV